MNNAIVVAGGKGSRMNSRLPKQFLKLGKHTILYHTVAGFVKNENIDEIILVIHQDYLDSQHIEDSIPDDIQNKNISIVAGGESRQESVYNGFQKLDSQTNIVLVHDGVRPFVDQETITQNIRLCQDKNAVLTAYPATNTLKRVKNNIVQETLDRDEIWQAQTPQTFKKDLLERAFDRAQDEDIIATDEASIVEKIADVHILKGNKNNIKITHPDDLVIANSILEEAE